METYILVTECRKFSEEVSAFRKLIVHTWLFWAGNDQLVK